MTNYEEAYESGLSFPRFLDRTEANRDLWHAFAERAPFCETAAARIRKLRGCWRLLVLADDWCGDAVNTVPLAARLARSLDNVELRIVPRDRYPELRDRHLTDGSRSIPIVIALDERGVPRGSWGPRPVVLQTLFEQELRALPGPERYREIRRWYARDKGASTARELAELIERAAEGTRISDARPCAQARTA